MTGVSVSLLFQSADELGLRPTLGAALARVTTICRGPKPTAALRGFGVTPSISAASPFTSAEVLDALGEVDVRGRSVLLFHYGERSATVAETLRARGANLTELWVYRWLMPEDTRGLEDLAARIISGEIDALAVTCQVQLKHLLRVVPEPAARDCLLRALDERVVVAAVGPTCAAILRAHDVRVEVMPEHPKMGPLVLALMQHLERARCDTPGPGADGGSLLN
jgi:uroporphyrinogen-III synthase